MIITCINCNKKFDIDTNLIPADGRLLQCSSCNHKWFFKKETLNKPVSSFKVSQLADEKVATIEDKEFLKENLNLGTKESSKTLGLLDKEIDDTPAKEKIFIKDKTENEEVKSPNLIISKKNFNILGLTIVFIITFIALILILDTFQKPISKFIPNIEFLLYNLYETINDIVLFFKDLI